MNLANTCAVIAALLALSIPTLVGANVVTSEASAPPTATRLDDAEYTKKERNADRKKVRELKKRLARMERELPEIDLTLHETRREYARALSRLGKNREAHKVFLVIERVCAKYRSPGDSSLLVARLDAASYYIEQGKHEKTNALFVAAWKEYASGDPTQNDYYFWAKVTIARSLFLNGDPAAALPLYEELYQHYEDALDRGDDDAIQVAIGFGATCNGIGQPDRARKVLEKAEKACRKAGVESVFNLGYVLVNLANSHRKLGDLEKAKTRLNETLTICKRTEPDSAELKMETLQDYAIVLEELGELALARQSLDQLIKLYSEDKKANRKGLKTARASLLRVKRRLKDTKKADEPTPDSSDSSLTSALREGGDCLGHITREIAPAERVVLGLDCGSF